MIWLFLLSPFLDERLFLMFFFSFTKDFFILSIMASFVWAKDFRMLTSAVIYLKTLELSDEGVSIASLLLLFLLSESDFDYYDLLTSSKLFLCSIVLAGVSFFYWYISTFFWVFMTKSREPGNSFLCYLIIFRFSMYSFRWSLRGPCFSLCGRVCILLFLK